MAPESNTPTTENTPAAAAAQLRIASPQAGQTATIAATDASTYVFDFALAGAPTERDGNNLVIDTPEGGRIVIEDFFVDRGEGLPVFQDEAGIEVSSAEYLESLGLDVATAAGGTTGGNAASGGTNYDDDGGNLLGGLDKFAKQGTIFWDRGSEEPEPTGGLRGPGGSFDFRVITDPEGFDFFIGAFEDGRPDQHLYGDNATLNAAQIELNLAVNPGTTVGDITLSQFPEGTHIYLGDPANGGQLVNPSGGTYTFSAGDFTVPGVFLVPPDNSDNDFDFFASVQLTGENGLTITPGGMVHVIVDAVADKPDMHSSGFTGTDIDGAITVDEKGDSQDGSAKQDLKDGWATDILAKNAGTDGNTSTDAGNVKVTATLEAKIQFGDYSPGDNSERHIALVEVPSGKNDNHDGTGNVGTWTPNVNQQGVTLLTETITLWFDPVTGAYITDGADPGNGAVSKTFFQFEISNDYLDANGGVADLKIDFTSTDSKITEDTTFTLETGAKAIETPTEGDAGELRLDNNVSYTFNSEYGQGGEGRPDAKFTVDTIDSKLTVNVGWASEDNSPHKDGGAATLPRDMVDHDGSGAHDHGEQGVSAGSTNSLGAPVIIGISGGDASGAHIESMSEVKITIPADADGKVLGTLVDSTGAALTGSANADGSVTYTFGQSAFSNGNTSLSGVYFQPSVQFGHGDVNLGYSVTVTADSGASAVYSGTTVAVVDAVADKPTGFTFNAPEYEGGTKAAALGETATLSGKVTFPDLSAQGNEKHYILLNVSHAVKDGWTVDGTLSQLTKDGVYDLFKGVGGEHLGIDDAERGSALYPTGVDANNPNEYLLIEVRQVVDNGVTQWKAYDAKTGLELSDSIVKITADGKGGITYEVDINAPSGANVGDDSATVWAKPFAVVADPNPGHEPGGEYDYGNNIAWGDSKSTTVKVAVATSGLTISVTNVYEGDAPHKNVGDMSESGGGKITLSHTGTDANKEIVHDIVINYNGDHGSVMLGNFEVPAGGGLQFHSVEGADGTIRYTSVDIMDADGNVMHSINANPASGQLFDNFVQNTLNLRYEPATGDHSDMDVKIDLIATIEDPASGDTAVISTNPDWASDPNLSNHAKDITGDLGNSTKYHEAPTHPAGGGVTVDAVADKGVLGAIANAYKEGTEAAAGEKVTVTVPAQFADVDGSEKHYILVEAKAGWSCEGATKVTVYFDASGNPLHAEGGNYYSLANGAQYNGQVTGKEYFQIDVTDTAADGAIHNYEVSLTTPSNLTSDVDITLKTGTLSVETVPSGSGAETATYNNEAYNLKDNTIKINVINPDYKAATTHGYEDNLATPAAQRDGTPTVGLATIDASIPAANLDHIMGSKNGETAQDITMTFKFEGTSDELGAFTYTDQAENAHTYTLNNGVTYDSSTGTYTLTIPAADQTSSASGTNGLKISYAPIHNDDHDLTNVDVKFEAHSNTSSSTGSYHATVDKVVVDAVADMSKGGFTDGKGAHYADAANHPFTYTDQAGHTVDQNGNVHDKAAPGGTVTIPVSATFGDYQDGSEKHYIIIEAKPDWTPKFDGNPADGKLASGGTTYHRFCVDGFIKAAVAEFGANPTAANSTFTYTDSATGITVTIGVDAQGHLTDKATVSLDVNLQVPTTVSTADKAFDFKTGGASFDDLGGKLGFDADGNMTKPAGTAASHGEITFDNNLAVDSEKVSIGVGVATSQPKITLQSNPFVYENNQPWAYSNKDDHSKPWEGQKSDPSQAQGAAISINGIDTGNGAEPQETVAVTFTIAFVDGSPANALGTDPGTMGQLVNSAGAVVGTFEYNSGVWSCTIKGLVNETLYFQPGKNFSDADLKLGYSKMVVTDMASGHTNDGSNTNTDKQPWTDTHDDFKGDIVVDAVAFKPEIDTDAGIKSWITSGFGMHMEATFQDFDGSENHYLLVQHDVNSDATVSSQFLAFMQELATAQGMDSAEACKITTVVEHNGDMAYQFSADLLIKACEMAKTDPDLQAKLDALGISFNPDSGILTVNVPMDVKDAYEGKPVNVWTGALATDHASDMEIPSKTHDGSDPVNNDRGISFSDNELKVGVVDSCVNNGIVYLYDDNSVTASVDSTASTGVDIKLGIAVSATDTADSVTFSEVPANGVLTYVGPDGSPAVVTAGTTITYDQAQTLHFNQNQYSDADGSIKYTVKFIDNHSGDVGFRSGQVDVLVDAKAQMPGAPLSADIDAMQNGGTPPEFTEGSTAKVVLQASFKDFDGSEKHYIAIEAKGGWSVTFADGAKAEIYTDPDTGKNYFLVPVDAACAKGAGDWTINGVVYHVEGTAASGFTVTATFDLTAAKEFYNHNVLGTNISNSGDLAYGALAIDYVRADSAAGHGSEFNFPNNYAFKEAGVLDIDYGSGPGIDQLRVCPTFENATPFAHEGDYTTYPDNGKIIIGNGSGHMLGTGAAITQVTLTLDGNEDGTGPKGTVTGLPAGTTWTENSDGTWSASFAGNGTGLKYVPDNYDDTDVTMRCTVNNGAGAGGENILVDAVAQQPTLPAPDAPGEQYQEHVAYEGTGATAVGKDSHATITLEAAFQDFKDGSEHHYMLLEKVPGMELDAGGRAVGEVEIGGKVYFTIELTSTDIQDDGKASIDVKVTLDSDEIARLGNHVPHEDKGNGVTQYTLDAGAMSAEKPVDGEVTLDNNKGYNLDGEAKINASTVHLSVSMSVNQAYEHGEHAWTDFKSGNDVDVSADKPGVINFSGSGNDGNDVITKITLGGADNADNGKGVLQFFNGATWQTLTEDNEPAIASGTLSYNAGTGVLTITGNASGINLANLNGLLRFLPTGDNHGQASLPYKVEIADGASSDTSVIDRNAGIDIDAVAQAPNDPNVVADSLHYSSGHESAQPGDTVTFEVNVSNVFHDTTVAGNYILVEQQNNWNGNYKTISLNIDGAGAKTYFQIPVSDADVTNGKITVTLNSPAEKVSDGDAHLDIDVRAMVVDEFGSGEAAGANNNIAFSDADKVHLDMGLAQGTTVEASADNMIESADGKGTVQIHFALTDGKSGGNDEVQSVTVKVPANGMLVVNGTEYTAAANPNGVTISGADLDKTFFKPTAHWSGSVTLDVTAATIVDSASGATKAATTFIDGSLTVAAVADAGTVNAPASVDTLQGNVIPGHQAQVAMPITGDFDDNDGSETHYFLVKVPAGVTLSAGTPMTAPAGCGLTDTVYKLTQNQASALKVTINGSTFADDSALKIVAVSEESRNDTAIGGQKLAYSGVTDAKISTDGVVFNLAPTVNDSTEENTLNVLRGTATTGGHLITGHVTDNDTGDTLKVASVNGKNMSGSSLTINGTYGHLTVNADGTYTYTKTAANPDLLRETFTYKVTDGYSNGTTTELTLTINMTDANTAPKGVVSAVTESIDAAGLHTGTLGFTDADGDHVDLKTIKIGDTTYDVAASGWTTIDAADYTLNVNAAGAYSIQLHDGAAPGDSLNFSYTGTDVFGAGTTQDGSFSLALDHLSYNMADHTGDTVDGTGIFGWNHGADITGHAAGYDTIWAGSGDDTAHLGAGGHSEFHGGAGDDTIYGGSSGYDTIHGDAGHDTIYGGAGGHSTIYGGEGDDTIHGGLAGYDTIHGGAGHDTIYGGAGGHSTIYGGEGNDTIHAGAQGYDTIHGGLGNDIMYSSDGHHNTFAWKSGEYGGTDTVLGFSSASGDKLHFSDLLSGDDAIKITHYDTNTGHVTIEVHSTDNVAQQVEVHFDSNDQHFNNFVNALNANPGDHGAEQQLLQDLITKMTGGS